MKPYVLSGFVLFGTTLWGIFPLPAHAQLSSSRRLSPPPVLKVPQSLPPTIYNSSDVHSPLPVPPNNGFSHIQRESKPIREYVFTSGSVPEPIPQIKKTRIKSSDRAMKPKVNRTAVKVKTVIPNRKPSIIENPIIPKTVATTTNKLYRVQVREMDAKSLAQVQNVEPLAFVRQTDGFIHAGTFSEKALAEQRVQALANQGVKAGVVAVPNSETNSNPVENLRFSRR